MDRAGASIRLDHKANVDRQVKRAGKDSSIPTDLLGQRLAPLGPEIALDEQGAYDFAGLGSIESIRYRDGPLPFP